MMNRNIAIGFACTFLVFVLIGISTIAPWDVEDKEASKYIQTQCKSLGVEHIPYRCCDIVSNKGCQSSCFHQSCSIMKSRLKEGECCGDSCCLSRVCQSCQRCSGTGKDRRCHIDSCCHRVCVLRGTEIDASVCGNCTRTEVEYIRYDNYHNINNFTLILINKCGRNDQECVQNLEKTYAVGTIHKCWYKDAQSDDTKFSKPQANKGLFIAAMVFFAFAITTILVFVCCYGCYVHEKNQLKKMNDCHNDTAKSIEEGNSTQIDNDRPPPYNYHSSFTTTTPKPQKSSSDNNRLKPPSYKDRQIDNYMNNIVGSSSRNYLYNNNNSKN